MVWLASASGQTTKQHTSAQEDAEQAAQETCSLHSPTSERKKERQIKLGSVFFFLKIVCETGSKSGVVSEKNNFNLKFAGILAFLEKETKQRDERKKEA